MIRRAAAALACGSLACLLWAQNPALQDSTEDDWCVLRGEPIMQWRPK